MEQSLAFFQKELAAAQSELRARRSAAFVDYDPQVCGIGLTPVTLKSYHALLAFQNAFVTGASVGFKDIFQFIWVHHPEFGQNNDAARLRVLGKVDRALTPALPTANALIYVFHPIISAASARSGLWRLLRPLAWVMGKLRRPNTPERVAEAIQEIRRILSEALHDFPDAGEDAQPLPFSQKPHFVALLVKGYPLDFETAARLVDTLPLKQLIEYIREILHRLSRGRDKLLTPRESAIWADYLAFKTAAARN